MDVVDKFRYVEVPCSLSRVQLLLRIEVLQTLIVCMNVHLDIYLLVSLFLERVHDSEKFFVMDWLVALCNEEGFCVVLDWIKLLPSADDMVLKQDTSKSLNTRISFDDCLQSSVELC